jgi:flagellin-like protein
MRKVYKNRNEEAVSPVIATILMVAITVVLAAVLYVMVIGMGSGGTQSAPVGTFSDLTATSTTSAKLTFGQFSPIPEPKDLRIILTPTTGGNPLTAQFTSNPGTATNYTAFTLTGFTAACYFDLNPAGNALNSGDYMNVYGLTTGTTYTVSIYYGPTESLCSLTGDVSFNTP